MQQEQHDNATDSRIGTTLAERYLLTELLGSGGMGSVYKAKHLQMDTLVAVKLINAAVLSTAGDNDGVALKRLRQEAQILGGLKHRLIPSVHCIDQSDSDLFIVMDYIDGVPLTNFVGKGNRLSRSQLLTIFLQLSEVFQYAHDKGVVHRDIKPANVMVTTDRVSVADATAHDATKQIAAVPATNDVTTGTNAFTGTLSPHVLDFGIAKFSYSTQKLTQTGAFVGTAQYVSPEQAMGTRVDPRSDIYSLVCVLYECLCGEPLFRADSPYEMLMKHAYDTLPTLDLPELDWVSEVLLRGLAKDPKDRYQSMEEFRVALEEAASVAGIPVVGDSIKVCFPERAKPVPANPGRFANPGRSANPGRAGKAAGGKRRHSKSHAWYASISLRKLMTAALVSVIALGGFALVNSGFHRQDDDSLRGPDPVLMKKMMQQLSTAALNKSYDDETMRAVKEAEFNYSGVIPDADRWLMMHHAASVYRARGDIIEAKRLWVTSIKAAHNYKAVGSEPIIRLANTIKDVDGRIDEAIELLERQAEWIRSKGFAKSEEGRLVLFHLANLYIGNNEISNAIRLYDEVAGSVDPGTQFVWWSRCTLPAADCRASLGDIAGAKSRINTWLDRSQNQPMRFVYLPQVYNSLGVLDLHDRDYKGAQQFFAKSVAAGNELVASNPEQKGYRRLAASQRSVSEEGLAGIAEHEKRYEEALRLAESSVALAESTNEPARLHKAKTFKEGLLKRIQKRGGSSSRKSGTP